ncbi:MAG: tRNA lysidine(34) synthetase TilS [Clostridia bacterium]|nr:tRNA lysidine(34) synthetase TilS [Clostridia bacterium]
MRITETLKSFDMLPAGSRVLCALSGGADSVCMTHWLAGNAQRLGIAVAAAHFSHGIRPEAAEPELALVRELCAALGIELFAGSGDVPELARRERIGVEEAARRLRYDFLYETADKWGADRIATAHNLEDNAETVLLSLIRGTGTLGLGGIPPVRGQLVRPLIETPRAEIEEYIRLHGLKYATDRTNLDDSYARNNIRLNVLPRLREINPAAAENIAASARLARSDSGLVRLCAEELAAGFRFEEGRAVADVQALRAAHPAASGRAVMLLCAGAGCGVQLGRRHVEAVLGICASDSPSAETALPDGFCARRIYGELTVERAAAAPQTPPEARIEGFGSVRWGDWELSVSRGRGEGWVFDADMLSFPLTVRSRREGDKIWLKGTHKSLKKVMIEEKIPKKIRDIIPVLWDNNGVAAAALIGQDRRRLSERDTEKITVDCRRIKR